MEYVPENLTLEEESIMGIIEDGDKQNSFCGGGGGEFVVCRLICLCVFWRRKRKSG